MAAAGSSLEHIQALSSILQTLEDHGILLESYEYDAGCFGGSVVILARGHAKARFIYNDKSSVLGVEHLKVQGADGAGSWVHDAYIQVPDQCSVYAEICSNAMAMLR